jgi:hypothetical protein
VGELFPLYCKCDRDNDISQSLAKPIPDGIALAARITGNLRFA